MQITQKEMSKMLLKLNEVGFNERELEILEDCKANKIESILVRKVEQKNHCI